METAVSAGKSLVSEKDHGDGDVIVIDDDDDLSETPSTPLNKKDKAVKPSRVGPSSGGTRPALSANPGKPKSGAQLSSAKSSSVPFRFEQPLTPGSVQNTTWKPVSFILSKQSQPITGLATQPITGLATQPITGLATQPITGLATQPITGLATQPITGLATQPITGLATQGMGLDQERALDSVQKSIGVMPLLIKPSQTSQPNIMTSLLGLQGPSLASNVPAGQTSGGVSQTGSESVVLVFPSNPQSTDTPQQAKAQAMMRSLLPKSPLSLEASGSIKALKQVYFIQEGQKLSQLKKVQLETKRDTLPTQTLAQTKNLAKEEIKGTLESIPKGAAKPINGSTRDSELGGNTKSITPPNVKIVTISKNGIVQPKISRVVVSNQSIVSQLKSGKKEIRAICRAKTGQSIKPLTSSTRASSPPVVQKSPNFIPILPLPSGQFVNSACSPPTVQPLLTSPAAMIVPGQFPLASSNVLTSQPSHMPATLQEGLYKLAKEANKSGKKRILFVSQNKNTSNTLSLILKGRPPTKSKATPTAQSKVTPPAQSSKSILHSTMFDKEGLSVTGKETGKKSLLSNNNRSGAKDNNRNGQSKNKNEQIFFTTLRTSNGQIAVKVIQPNLSDEKEPDWLPEPSLLRTMLIKDNRGEEPCEQPLKNASNLPPENPDAGLVDYQSRIKKASKLEKIVENILRSHKTDDNVTLEKPHSAELLICAGSQTVENSISTTQEIVPKPVATESSSNISQDKVEFSDKNDLDLKITSVYSLNPDSSFPNEPNDIDLSENSFTCKVEDSQTWNKVVTPCFTVVERLPRCRSDTDKVCGTMSHCSEHCRNRTLDYLCNLNLLKCECIHDQHDGVQSCQEDQPPSCVEETVVPREENNISEQSLETKIAECAKPNVGEVHQILGTKIEEETLNCTKASLEISQDDQLANSLTIQTRVDSKPECPQTDVKCVSKVAEPVINFSSMVHPVTSSPNPKPTIQENASLHAQNVQVSPQTRSSVDLPLIKSSPPKVKKATGRHLVSLLNPSLLSPGIVNRSTHEVLLNPSLLSPGIVNRSNHEVLLNPSLLSPGIVNRSNHEVLSSPEGSISKKGMGPKEFQRLLAELKVQVESKRKDMKRLHQIKKKIKGLGERHAREGEMFNSSELTKKREIKVVFPFMAKKSAIFTDSSKSGTKTGINLSTKQVKSSSTKLTSPQKLQPAVSVNSSPGKKTDKQSSTTPDKQSSTPPGLTIKPVSSERITEAISSLTKYLLTTGTKVTSDNNKYFLLKVDEQHVLVKIPQNFPLNKHLTPMSTLPSTAPKHVPIKPKPDAHAQDSKQQKPSVRPSLALKHILPQSQRSVTLMARINKTRSGDQDSIGSNAPALVKSDASIPSSSTVKVDLTHLPLNSSLLPERKKRNSELTEEEKKAKRAKLEAKYPLPPGVKIKCEPDDQMDYLIDDNWTVTSEFLSASSITESTGCGQSDNSVASVEECDEPPMLMSVSPVSPEAVVEMQDEAEDETPPLLQLMLPASSCHGSESTENLEEEAKFSKQVLGVASGTSLSSCESGYVSDSKKSIEMPNSTNPKPAYKNSKIERLKELLKKKEMEIEEIRRMRNTLSKTESS